MTDAFFPQFKVLSSLLLDSAEKCVDEDPPFLRILNNQLNVKMAWNVAVVSGVGTWKAHCAGTWGRGTWGRQPCQALKREAHCARACRDLTSARCATISDDDAVLQDACDACALCVKGEQNTAAWNSSGEFINRVTSIKKRYYMLRLFAKKKYAKVHASSLGLYPRGFVCKPAPCKQSNSTTRRSHEVSAGIMSQTFHPTNNFGVVKLTQAKMKTEGQRCTAAGYVEEGEPNIGTSLAMCG